MASEFETFLDDKLSAPADQLNRRAKRAATLSARLLKAVAVGDMRVVEAALRDLEAGKLDEPLTASADAAKAYDYRDYLANGFAADFEEACRAAKLPLEGNFPNYSVFPFSVRIDLDNPSAIINRKRVGTLRPSALVAAIADERDRLERSPFNVNEFLGVLFSVWERMNAVQARKTT